MNPWQQVVNNHMAYLTQKKPEPVKPAAKQCSVCKQFLGNSNFYARPGSKDGTRTQCKTCYIKSRNKRKANVVS